MPHPDPNASDASIHTEFDADSDTMLVAFGGMYGDLNIPVFEFRNITAALPVKRLFVRDWRQAWYQNGLPGVGDDLDTIAAELRQLIDVQQPQRIVTVGSSAGGYAALMFGHLLGVDTALSFAPQTFIGRWRRWFYRDRRWQDEIQQIYAANCSPRRYRNLKAVLADSNRMTRYHIFYDSHHYYDRLHAERLRGVPNVQLHPQRGGGHTVVRHLRESGALLPLLQRAVTGEPLDID